MEKTAGLQREEGKHLERGKTAAELHTTRVPEAAAIGPRVVHPHLRRIDDLDPVNAHGFGLVAVRASRGRRNAYDGSAADECAKIGIRELR